MAFGALEEILEQCSREGEPFWRVVLKDDINERNVTEEESIRQMEELWDAMLLAAALYDEKIKLPQRLNRRRRRPDGSLRTKRRHLKRPLYRPGDCRRPPDGRVQCLHEADCGSTHCRSLRCASCGVGSLFPGKESIRAADYRSAICGSWNRPGDCGKSFHCRGIRRMPGEIGTASAMAAGACVQLKGGTDSQIAQASAMALKNLLGLVCDPVAGLVEVPCVKRNVIGAVNALAAADMALAGIESRIPPDQVFDAMKEVGDKMAKELKETGEGGLAGTAAGREIAVKILGK